MFYSERLKRHIIVLESKKLYFKEDGDQLLLLASKDRKRANGLKLQKRTVD